MKRSKGKRKNVQDQLSEDYACYVLVTCDAPEENGNMDVEVTYQGPPILASYLLEGAQSYLDQKVEEEMEALNLTDTFQD